MKCTANPVVVPAEILPDAAELKREAAQPGGIWAKTMGCLFFFKVTLGLLALLCGVPIALAPESAIERRALAVLLICGGGLCLFSAFRKPHIPPSPNSVPLLLDQRISILASLERLTRHLQHDAAESSNRKDVATSLKRRLARGEGRIGIYSERYLKSDHEDLMYAFRDYSMWPPTATEWLIEVISNATGPVVMYPPPEWNLPSMSPRRLAFLKGLTYYLMI